MAKRKKPFVVVQWIRTGGIGNRSSLEKRIGCDTYQEAVIIAAKIRHRGQYAEVCSRFKGELITIG